MLFARTVRAGKLRPIRFVAAIAAAVIPLSVLVAGPAGAVTPRSADPTIVLVHGAWTDASSWAKEVALLQHEGHPVVVAPNPLRGLTYDSAYLRKFLATIGGPIVLVGQSYGGAVISNAATGNKHVKALIFIDAFLPAKGESIANLVGAHSVLAPATTNPTAVFKLVSYPGAPAGAVDTYVHQKLFISGFANGLPAKQAAVLAASQSPTSTLAFQPSGTPAWKTIASYDLIGLGDKVITPVAQEFMAHRAGAQIVKYKGGHLGIIAKPLVVSTFVSRVANSLY